MDFIELMIKTVLFYSLPAVWILLLFWFIRWASRPARRK